MNHNNFDEIADQLLIINRILISGLTDPSCIQSDAVITKATVDISKDAILSALGKINRLAEWTYSLGEERTIKNVFP